MPLVVCLATAVRQVVAPRAAGLTHASTVMPVVRSSEALSLIATELLLPLNDSAPPYLPAAVHVVPEVEPLLPVPDPSPAVVPVPSLKPYAATRPGGAAAACAVVRPQATAMAPTRHTNPASMRVNGVPYR